MREIWNIKTILFSVRRTERSPSLFEIHSHFVGKVKIFSVLCFSMLYFVVQTSYFNLISFFLSFFVYLFTNKTAKCFKHTHTHTNTHSNNFQIAKNGIEYFFEMKTNWKIHQIEPKIKMNQKKGWRWWIVSGSIWL